jgi:hypothetical protein
MPLFPSDKLDIKPPRQNDSFLRGYHALTPCSLSGSLFVTLKSSSSLEKILIRFYGYAELKQDDDYGRRKRDALVDLKITLYDKKTAARKLDNGEHEYAFNFNVPSDLPDAVETIHGNVEYFIVAEMHKAAEKIRSDPIPIVLCRYAAAVADVMEFPPSVWKSIDTLHAHVTVELPSKFFSPGDQIPVVLKDMYTEGMGDVHQACRVRKGRVVVELYQTRLFRHDRPFSRGKVLSKTEQTWQFDGLGYQTAVMQVRVPLDGVLASGDAGLICIAHRVRVRIYLDGVKEDLSMVQPILVTLIPFDTRAGLQDIAAPWEITAAKKSLEKMRSWAKRAVLLQEGVEKDLDPELEPSPFLVEEEVEELASTSQLSTFKSFSILPVEGRSTLVRGYHGLSGAAVTGRVMLELNRPLCARELTIHLHGEEYLSPLDGVGRQAKHRSIIKQSIRLWTGTGDVPNLADTLVFDFSFPLALDLPESVRLHNSGIRYGLTAELKHVGALGNQSKIAQAPLQLVRCLLNASPLALYPHVWSSDAKMEAARHIKFQVTVPKRVLAPHDTTAIHVFATALNDNLTITAVQAELLETIVERYTRPRVTKRVLATMEKPTRFSQNDVTLALKRSDVGEPSIANPYALVEIRHRLIIRLNVSNGIDYDFSCPVALSSVALETLDAVTPRIDAESIEASDSLLAQILEDEGGAEEEGFAAHLSLAIDPNDTLLRSSTIPRGRAAIPQTMRRPLLHDDDDDDNVLGRTDTVLTIRKR